MAYWVVGPGYATGTNSHAQYVDHHKVNVSSLSYLVLHEEHEGEDGLQYKSRSHDYHSDEPEHEPRLEPPLVESTESGLSLSSASVSSLAKFEQYDKQAGVLLGDLEAADKVAEHVASSQKRNAYSKYARILRALINPRGQHLANIQQGSQEPFPLDEDALRSLFSAANELFFAGELSQRVAWDWSDSSSSRFEHSVVGTTAVRRSKGINGWETLMVLSSPVLRDPGFSRHLLIATFLHEMIHSFLYIKCGLDASRDGGHTEGFRRIACIIDEWAGRDYLRLAALEADLDYFRLTPTTHQGYNGGMNYHAHSKQTRTHSAYDEHEARQW